MNGTCELRGARSKNGRYALALLFGLLLAPAVGRAADEITYMVGAVSSQSQWPASDSWSLEYRSNWLPNFSTTFSYLNDGHFPGHHRDGITAEIWPQVNFFGRHLTLAAGAGPFYYYDTVVAENGGGYADSHGLTWVFSGAVILRTGSIGPVFELRYDHTSPDKTIVTNSLSVGFGYRLKSDFSSSSESPSADLAANEVTGFYGHTQVNSFAHQESRAWAAEYRRRIWDAFRVTGGFVNEGDAQLIRRSGFVYEAWLEPSFFDGVYSVGLGFGGYSAIDKYQPAPGRHVSDVVSLTMSYQLVQHVAARFNWHRIVTDYNRDTDIVLFGLGIRF